MKKRRFLFLLPGLLLIAISGCTGTGPSETVASDDLSTSLDGVHEYLVEGGTGLSFYDRGYYVHFLIPEGVEPGPEGLSDEQRIELYRGLSLSAGTYTVSGDTCTNQILYHKDPGQVGTSFRWVAEFYGDTLQWSVVNDAGEVTNRGRSLRLR